MKYFFGQQNLVFQKVDRKDDISKTLTLFEQEYHQYQSDIEGKCQKFQIPLQCDYLRIYLGQLIVIIYEILKHLNELHNDKLCHGQLTPENIWIRLEDQTGFTITYQKIKIKNAFFINYKYFEDSQYQFNVQEDIEQISNSIIKLIDAMQQNFQKSVTLKQIREYFVQDLNNIKAYQLIGFFEELKDKQLDTEFFKVKKTQEFDEFDEDSGRLFGWFNSKREQTEEKMKIYIEKLAYYHMNSEIQVIKLTQKKVDNFETKNFISKFQSDEEERLYFDVIGPHFQKGTLKKFCKYIGNDLKKETISYSFEEYVKQFEDQININLQILHDELFQTLRTEYQNIGKFCEEKQEEIEKFYKYEIKQSIQKAQNLFKEELKYELQSFDIYNSDISHFFQKVKDSVKVLIDEWYNLEVQLYILKLINELI